MLSDSLTEYARIRSHHDGNMLSDSLTEHAREPCYYPFYRPHYASLKGHSDSLNKTFEITEPAIRGQA